MPVDVAHEVALVTGAGSGIGRACALALAQVGTVVAVTDVDAAGAKETHDLIAADGGASHFYRLDVTEEKDWDGVVREVEQRHGAVSVLVNNAGYKASQAPGDQGLVDLDLPTWDRMMSVNLRGPMLGSRRVLPSMLDAGHGTIIMLSSITALACPPSHGTAYTTTKTALLGLTRSIAVSYGPRGVRCNAVAPGIIAMDEASTDGFTGQGRPADIANAVVFLASEAASFVNGHTLIVDGGLLATTPGLTTMTLHRPEGA
jgi:NAD(P)-dependent dehydrogenase (short-subunit alcohol dehydrogenase family)